MVLIRYSDLFNCLKRKKNWIRKETYQTPNETFHQRFNFSSWKKGRKQTSICFRNKTTFTFSKKRKEKRNMFLSWFPIFFNPLDIIWVFNNLPSLNSIILLLMSIFYLFKVLLPAPFFLYFFFGRCLAASNNNFSELNIYFAHLL